MDPDLRERSAERCGSKPRVDPITTTLPRPPGSGQGTVILKLMERYFLREFLY